MDELKPSEINRLMELLRGEAKFQADRFGRRVLSDELIEAAHTLEALNRPRYEVRNNSVQNKKAVTLAIENAQLRSVIEQFEPDFFTRKCRDCGCDWNHPCGGGCSWVGDDLCSACFQKMLKKPNEKQRKTKKTEVRPFD